MCCGGKFRVQMSGTPLRCCPLPACEFRLAMRIQSEFPLLTSRPADNIRLTTTICKPARIVNSVSQPPRQLTTYKRKLTDDLSGTSEPYPKVSSNGISRMGCACRRVVRTPRKLYVPSNPRAADKLRKGNSMHKADGLAHRAQEFLFHRRGGRHGLRLRVRDYAPRARQ